MKLNSNDLDVREITKIEVTDRNYRYIYNWIGKQYVQTDTIKIDHKQLKPQEEAKGQQTKKKQRGQQLKKAKRKQKGSVNCE
jgi:hypothetical protein